MVHPGKLEGVQHDSRHMPGTGEVSHVSKHGQRLSVTRRGRFLEDGVMSLELIYRRVPGTDSRVSYCGGPLLDYVVYNVTKPLPYHTPIILG